MSTARIGIGLRSHAIVAVAVEGERVVWRGTRAIATSAQIGDTLLALLRELPRSRRARPVRVALGPAFAHVRRLAGLPQSDDAQALTAAVAENLGRFFLLPTAPVRASRVVPLPNGEAWAATFDETTLLDVSRAVSGVGLRIEAIMPTVFALAEVAADGAGEWTDGDHVVAVEIREAQLHRLRASDSGAGSATPLTWRTSLTRVEPDPNGFAEAYGATVVHPPRAPIALGIGAFAGFSGSARTLGSLRKPAMALAFALSAASFAPAITALIVEHVAVARLRADPSARAEVASLERSVDRRRRALGRLADFTSSRRSRTAELATISDVLPESCAVASLQIDSASVEVAIIAPRVGEVLQALEGDGRLWRIELAGSIARPTGSVQALERATVRFRFKQHERPTRLLSRVDPVRGPSP